MQQKKFTSAFLLCALFTISTFPLFAELIPHSDSEAKNLFITNPDNEKSLTLLEQHEHTKIDSVFWRTDKRGNTYYKIYDNIENRYGILQINLETKKHNLFYAGDYNISQKYSKSCSIAHFDVSDDGTFLFLELFLRDKINQIVCVNLKNNTYTLLLDQKPRYWITSSLVYSSTANQLYYYAFPYSQRINNQNVYYDIGLYVFPKIDGDFAAENVQRYFNLPEWVIRAAYDAFINSANPDYKGLLDWIYYFADKDCSPVFCVTSNDGRILNDEEALKYSIENNLFKNNNLYLQKAVVKIKDGKPTNESALSTINNSTKFFSIIDQSIKVYWLLKTDDGIWFIRERDAQKKQADGTYKTKNEYYAAHLIEDKTGNFSDNYTSMLDVKIKAACNDTVSTIQTAYGSLIYKDYITDKWNVYKNGERTECKNFEAALENAKKRFFKENEARRNVKTGNAENVEIDDVANEKTAVSPSATINTDIANKDGFTSNDKITPTIPAPQNNSQTELQADSQTAEQDGLNQAAQNVSQAESQIDAQTPQKSRTNKNPATIIALILLIFICLAELAAILIILSKKFNQHLSKKGKRFIFKIQEEERTKLSRDIHDSVVQNIRAIRLDAEMLQVEPASEPKKQRVIEEMTNVIALLRNICYNFHPAELSVQTDNTELISIIDTLCQQFISRTKIPCNIQIQKDFVPPQMNTEKSTNIIRVIQEALANIEKHSYATNVQILIKTEIETKTKSLVIFVIDDGIGCEVNKLGKGKMNFGIRNMRERIAAAGGEIEFFSTPNEGLSVQLRVPY